ncbi:hypothetical protein [Streptomyces sp. A0592]|uniref:hypothetical protein n=1 Tax=Streptomyces sp. A0592 TaxID=2563099 RepID=UPI00109E479D|nr:hypothetical protein [Streptomyces sp. A0592]THA82768.1 hypothetical protein E6U81_19700 [Streptomyces sp. A0592]
MFGSKTREITDLKRALRVRTQERDDALEDARGYAASARHAEKLLRDRDQQEPEAARAAEAPIAHSDELWSLIDWSLWGSGMGDTFREALADQFIRAITPQQHEQALRLIQAWTDSGRGPLGRRRYEDQQARLHRALRACARYRADEARLTRHAAGLQARYDHAVGIDHPDVDAGARWQETRIDRRKGVVR